MRKEDNLPFDKKEICFLAISVIISMAVTGYVMYTMFTELARVFP